MVNKERECISKKCSKNPSLLLKASLQDIGRKNVRTTKKEKLEFQNPHVAIRATMVIKIREEKQEDHIQILHDSIVCLHPRE